MADFVKEKVTTHSQKRASALASPLSANGEDPGASIPLDLPERRAIERRAIEDAIRTILVALALPLDHELEDTPRRVADLLEEFTQPRDLKAILKQGFDHDETGDQGIIVQTGIPFRGLCAHHLLPFFGVAHVGYIPRHRVVGLSKLTRLVQAAGTLRPSKQETITNLIADALHEGVEAIGVGVVTEATHSCMSVRGVNTPGVITKVSALRGAFIHNPQARSEFLSLIN